MMKLDARLHAQSGIESYSSGLTSRPGRFACIPSTLSQGACVYAPLVTPVTTAQGCWEHREAWHESMLQFPHVVNRNIEEVRDEAFDLHSGRSHTFVHMGISTTTKVR